MTPKQVLIAVAFVSACGGAVLAAGGAAPATAPALAIANAGFEKGEGGAVAGWHWWSRTKHGSAGLAADEKHGGAGSARLRHDGPRDWALSSETHLPARFGQHFRISAWVKVRSGTVTVAVVARGKGEVLAWDVGSAGAGAAEDKWVHLDAPVTVPEGCDDVYVRFVGEGETLAWVDDVELRPWTPPPPRPRPKVQGYAFEGRRVRERLGRGLIARPTDGGKVYVGWRLLDDDGPDAAFNVYRRVGDGPPVRLTDEPVRRTTDFVDAAAPAGVKRTYTVRAATAGGEGPTGEPALAAPDANATPYISIRLRGDYTVQKVGIADLDGDGRYDFVIKQPEDNIDPYEKYWKKSPDTYKLEAYLHDGTFLWRCDLGWAIERGIWYSPYLVYDLDGDGRAEVIAKTGEGDPRGEDGRVRTGPEYVSVLDGRTGRLLARADWPSRDLFTGPKGYNHASRNQLSVAYLDGKTPCLIVERGTYDVIVLDAYEFHGGSLRKLWNWSNQQEPRRYWGQGAHTMHVADVDGDGRDEVLIGSAAIDDDGASLWTTGLGHPDHFYVGDLMPDRPGLEIYYGIETPQKRNGMCMVCAATGQVLWGWGEPTKHIHEYGLVSDIDPNHGGAECYSGERDLKDKRWLWSARGEVLSTKDIGGLAPRAAYWNADPQRELVVKSAIYRYCDGPQKPLQPRGVPERHESRSGAPVEGRFVAVADVLGDWREEILTSVPGELRIYTTAIPAADRRVCLMLDPIYRIDVAQGAMGYYHVPTLSYDLATARPAPTAGAARPASP